MPGGNSKSLEICLCWVLMRVVLTAGILVFLRRWHGSNVCPWIFMAHARWQISWGKQWLLIHCPNMLKSVQLLFMYCTNLASNKHQGMSSQECTMKVSLFLSRVWGLHCPGLTSGHINPAHPTPPKKKKRRKSTFFTSLSLNFSRFRNCNRLVNKSNLFPKALLDFF